MKISEIVRNTVAGLMGLSAVGCYLQASYALSSLSGEKWEILIGGVAESGEGLDCSGRDPWQTVFWGMVLLIFAVALFFVGRVCMCPGSHGRSRTVMTLFLISLPVQKILFFWIRYITYRSSDLSAGRIKNLFLRNMTILEGILIFLTLVFALIKTPIVRSGEEKKSRPVKNTVRAGLMGALNAAGYEVSDLILTEYDGKSVAILLFDTQEVLEEILEKGDDAEILAICRRSEPKYEYRFEVVNL